MNGHGAWQHPLRACWPPADARKGRPSLLNTASDASQTRLVCAICSFWLDSAAFIPILFLLTCTLTTPCGDARGRLREKRTSERFVLVLYACHLSLATAGEHASMIFRQVLYVHLAIYALPYSDSIYTEICAALCHVYSSQSYMDASIHLQYFAICIQLTQLCTSVLHKK